MAMVLVALAVAIVGVVVLRVSSNLRDVRERRFKESGLQLA
jgi:hypothetical protein